MAEPMKEHGLPRTDSIKELAEFWDTHEVTAFQDRLEEVVEPVFKRSGHVDLQLDPDELAQIDRLARSKGVSEAELLHEWVREKLRAA
jgi:hypothetical protein